MASFSMASVLSIEAVIFNEPMAPLNAAGFISGKGLTLIFIHYLLHFIHQILLIKNTYKGYPGYREILIFKKSLGEKFIKKGFFPSIYSYSEERHLFFIISPIFRIFREFLIVSLFLSLIFKVFSEILLLSSKRRTKELQAVVEI